jgi:hypothetical protein
VPLVFAVRGDARRNTGSSKPFGIQFVYFYPERTSSFNPPFAQKASGGRILRMKELALFRRKAPRISPPPAVTRAAAGRAGAKTDNSNKRLARTRLTGHSTFGRTIGHGNFSHAPKAGKPGKPGGIRF